MRTIRVLGAVAIGAAALSSCRDARGAGAEAPDTSYRLRPGYVVDSVRPVEVELEAFRTGLGPAPTELAGGAPSFEALLQKFAEAVERRDTTALRSMQISASEFAWLVYPSSPYTRPPYRESPRMIWQQLRGTGDVGLTRLVQRRGGSPITIIAHGCDAEPAIEGDNRLWRHCRVTTRAASGAQVTERLFGVVVERHGHFKFASYQNQY